MDDIQSFLSPSQPSLKICGVTSSTDAKLLVASKVSALGVNFWPHSKRYCPPAKALGFLPSLAGQIVRVGVFVNNAPDVAPQLLEENAIDIIQLHGDEDEDQLVDFLDQKIPVIRSLALKPGDNLASVIQNYRKIAATKPNLLALLLDTHAPGVYGGTGETVDWKQAAKLIRDSSSLPVFLAGGITPDNSNEAIKVTQPAGLDVASGAERAPGIKDFKKVSALQASIQLATSQ